MADQNERYKRLFNRDLAPDVPTTEESRIELAQDRARLKYAEKIVKHMIDLSIWRKQMCDSMLTYIDKVLNQIYNLYQQGMNMLIAARTDKMEDLQLILNDEKEEAEMDLYNKCEQMKELIDKVIKNPSSNKALKQQVLALLQVMRKPKLPDLTLITKTLKTSVPKKHNKMRAMFSSRSTKKKPDQC